MASGIFDEESNRDVSCEMTSNPLVSKLEYGTTLSDEDRARLEKLCEHTVEVSARKSIIEEGDKPDDVHLVMQGLGCRYTLLENGNRSITALLLPGDFCNLHVATWSDGSRHRNVGVVSHCENSPDNDRRLDQQPADRASSMVVDSG